MPHLRVFAFVSLAAVLAPASLEAIEPVAAFTPGARILFQGDPIHRWPARQL